MQSLKIAAVCLLWFSMAALAGPSRKRQASAWPCEKTGSTSW